jgi:uncharacterized protein YrrD
MVEVPNVTRDDKPKKIMTSGTMLRSIKQLYGDTLSALDGEIGHVKDFYFDDQTWAVRYMIVDTGSWLTDRVVLISPHALTNFYRDGASRSVNLTREQIKNSPSIDSHKPVSRQYEERYYRYYEWPPYWDGGLMWGTGGYPTALPPYPAPLPPTATSAEVASGDDPHLRSTRALVGYHVQCSDGEAGHITDFIVHEKSWAICHLIVETGHWYAAKEIAIAPQHIERISYEDSRVSLNVTREAILDAPEYDVPPWAYSDAQSIAD